MLRVIYKLNLFEISHLTEPLMKPTLLASAICASLLAGPAFAEAPLEDRVKRLEQLLEQLQGQVDDQGKIIARQDQVIQRQGKTIQPRC